MLKVLDLFAGMGGLAIGFKKEGFDVKGYDINPITLEVFKINMIGEAVIKDLSRTVIDEYADVIVGGPPCKPWSNLNITLKGNKHPDYILLDRFFLHIKELQPKCFILENVPPLQNDEKFNQGLEKIRKIGYSVSFKKIVYSEFGASTSRKRLFTVGFIDGNSAREFFEGLDEYRTDPKTVMESIQSFLQMKKGDFPDHVWPELKTIEKYEEFYKTGKYGWYHLKPDKPAPSFGNVMKTYILHPHAGINGYSTRVISIREGMSIMGFDSNFKFPEKIGMSIRYQMVADAVSPVFSGICAKIIKELLI